MPKAICRCGQPLTVSAQGAESERVVCPGCGARVRIRRGNDTGGATEAVSDGFIRFFCPCGKRLKVPSANPPSYGKCPDCGSVVPVPAASRGALPAGHPETPTAELNPSDLETLERWSHDHLARAANATDTPDTTQLGGPPPLAPSTGLPPRAEVGLRLCPSCRRPVHMGRDVCRECGTPVPRR